MHQHCSSSLIEMYACACHISCPGGWLLYCNKEKRIKVKNQIGIFLINNISKYNTYYLQSFFMLNLKCVCACVCVYLSWCVCVHTCVPVCKYIIIYVYWLRRCCCWQGSSSSTSTDCGLIESSGVTGELELALAYSFSSSCFEVVVGACRNLTHGDAKKKKCHPSVQITPFKMNPLNTVFMTKQRTDLQLICMLYYFWFATDLHTILFLRLWWYRSDLCYKLTWKINQHHCCDSCYDFTLCEIKNESWKWWWQWLWEWQEWSFLSHLMLMCVCVPLLSQLCKGLPTAR